MSHRLIGRASWPARRAAIGVGALVLALGSAAVPTGAQAADSTTSRSVPAANASTPRTVTKPTVVLVHGAFADASGWNGVITRLTRAGYPVRALPNPLRGPATDSADIGRFLDTIPGPVVLVGHSYGGAVITNAAAGKDNVKALVYVAALAPETGERLADLQARPVEHPAEPLPAQAVPTVLPDGTPSTDIYIDPARFREHFAADVPAVLATPMAAAQRPIAASAAEGVTPHAAWHEIPSWYLVAKQDHAISPDLQRFMAARAGAHLKAINSSHAAMVSHPGAVSSLIEAADRATR